MEILDGMRKRLKRRNILLDEVRKAYLSDLVASNAPIKKRASAINLQPMLALYAPSVSYTHLTLPTSDLV